MNLFSRMDEILDGNGVEPRPIVRRRLFRYIFPSLSIVPTISLTLSRNKLRPSRRASDHPRKAGKGFQN